MPCSPPLPLPIRRTSSSGACSGFPKCARRRANPYADHKSGDRKCFAWTEYRDLLIVAHQQPGGPIFLIWDSLDVHKGRRMREFIDAHGWLMANHLHLPPAALRT
ncbi:hypothetical protein [Streptomyces sp. NPDC054901]